MQLNFSCIWAYEFQHEWIRVTQFKKSQLNFSCIWACELQHELIRELQSRLKKCSSISAAFEPTNISTNLFELRCRLRKMQLNFSCALEPRTKFELKFEGSIAAQFQVHLSLRISAHVFYRVAIATNIWIALLDKIGTPNIPHTFGTPNLSLPRKKANRVSI